MNHNIDNKFNIKTERRALLVLPVAFDNQGGLASAEQSGPSALSRLYKSCHVCHCHCNVSVIIF